ncbi:hypothetical protein, partial [Mesorhizobium sp.]|uniref:hypothetical protein n=1 Tax=Mesorhizobium sp. TaxID=1871066 RepID=UPI0025D0B8EF
RLHEIDCAPSICSSAAALQLTGHYPRCLVTRAYSCNDDSPLFKWREIKVAKLRSDHFQGMAKLIGLTGDR